MSRGITFFIAIFLTVFINLGVHASPKQLPEKATVKIDRSLKEALAQKKLSLLDISEFVSSDNSMSVKLPSGYLVVRDDSFKDGARIQLIETEKYTSIVLSYVQVTDSIKYNEKDKVVVKGEQKAYKIDPSNKERWETKKIAGNWFFVSKRSDLVSYKTANNVTEFFLTITDAALNDDALKIIESLKIKDIGINS